MWHQAAHRLGSLNTPDRAPPARPARGAAPGDGPTYPGDRAPAAQHPTPRDSPKPQDHGHGQFIVIHTVKDFGIVNKAEVDVFLELSCFFARKARNPFQTTQGNRLSCRAQEGRRGSDEAVPGPSVLPSRETGVWGTFGGCMKGVRYRFALQDRTWDFP